MQKRFLEIWRQHIHREGADFLLTWLERSDFFTAPASTKFHGAYEGGLCEHSVNVYERLVQLVNALLPEDDRPSNETLAIVALCHDLCKVNVYQTELRNRKNEQTGQWEKYPVYVHNDKLGMGHGEASMYIVSVFMKLSREEALAIRWHMGFSDEAFKGGSRAINTAWEQYPLGMLLHAADLAASFLDEAR